MGWGKGFQRRLGRKKGRNTQSLDLKLPLQRSLRTLLGFREKRLRGRGWAGAWREGAGANSSGQGQRSEVQVARDVSRS